MEFEDGLDVREITVNNGGILTNETSDKKEELELAKGENSPNSTSNKFRSEYNVHSSSGMCENNENSEISVLTSQLAYERNENERLQENIYGLQESLVKCKQELLEYQKRAYDSEILSTRHQHEYKLLEHEKCSLQESLSKQKDETSIMENKLKELHALKNNNLIEYTKKVSHLEVSCRDLEHKLSIIQKSRDELEMEHSKICDELRRVKSELEFAKGHYEEKIKIKEESIKLKEEQIKQIQGLLDMSISTTQNLENEIELYKKNEEISYINNSKSNIVSKTVCFGENSSDIEGRKLTDVQAAELLVKIFGEKFLNSVSSSNDIENSSDSSNIGSRRVLIDLLTQIEDYQQNLEESRKEIYTLKEELKECQYHLKVTVPDFELTRQKYETLQAENSFAMEQLQSLTQERRILMHRISEYKTLWEHEANKREIYEEQCKMITSKLSMFVSNENNREEGINSGKINTEIGNNNSPCNSSGLLSPISITGVYDDIIEQNTQLKLQISRLIDGIEMESQIQVRKLNSEISSYKEQFSKMKKERDELVSQYQELINKLEDENNSLKNKNLTNLEDGKGNVEKFKKEDNDPSGNISGTSTFIKQFGEVTEVCKSLSEKLTNEIEQSAQYRSELSRYKAQCEYMENLCERNRKRMDELFEERDQLFKQVNDLRKTEDSKESELNSYKEKVLIRESEIMDIKRENDYLKNNISNLNNCISGLKNEIELSIKQRNQDNALQRDIISQLQGELEGKYAEINSMRKSQDLILQREFDESQRLRQQLKGEYNKYHDLEVRYKEIQLEKENLDKRNTELEEKLSNNALVFSTIENGGISNSKESNVTIEDENEREDINSIKSSLEESRKLQNYWKDLVHSTEKQLENKMEELNELRNREEILKIELQEKIELINKIEEDNKKEQERLNENIKTMTLRISSVDEEILKRESDLRDNLSKASEENSILKKEIQESKQIEHDLRSQYQNIVRMHSVDIERLQNSSKQCSELREEIKKIINDSKKTENENTNLIMEMQNDINQLRRQLELSIQKYESVKLDSENYRDLLIKLRNDKKLPQDYERLLESELPSEINVEKEDKATTLVHSSNIGVNSSSSASFLLMRKVQALTSNLEELDTKLNESSIEIQRLSFEKKSLRDENEFLQKRLAEELEKVTEFATKAESNENTLIRLGELVTLRETNDRLRKELINATERYTSVEKKFESETRSIDPLKCEIRKLNAEIEELKSQCEEKSVLSKTWEEQYNRILISYDNINPDDINKMKDEINKLKSLNEGLKNTIETKNKEYDKLQSEKQSEHVSTEELQLTRQQMEQLRKVYMSTNQKLKEERNKNTKLENEIKKLGSVSADISNNPNTNKLNNNDIKNFTQATNNLVNLVLKLTKFSLLRLELDKNKSLSAKECIDDVSEDVTPLKKRPISISVDKHSIKNDNTPPNNQSNLH
ncbi:hypothetical protein FG386_001827 [Cryptosporidium ryanae]|uniref:uncharacterized protein n=1 Tax=Cryptosporidium ryanae TaxID=515981 RepID=UPI00351A9A0E|nr:hypothetical protein FG386_001827 [Cryptosporidium ryanae]